MAQKIALIFFRQVEVDGKKEFQVLLAKRGSMDFSDPSIIRSQEFAGGMQILVVGTRHYDDIALYSELYLDLRRVAGEGLCDWINHVLRDKSRLITVNEQCLAVEVRHDEVDSFIELNPNFNSIGWYSVTDIAKFKDLEEYRDRVPKDTQAIFKDESEWIRALSMMVERGWYG